MEEKEIDIFQQIVKFYILLKKHWKFILLFTLAGFAAGFVYTFLIPDTKVYQTTFRSRFITPADFMETTEYLNSAIHKQNAEILSNDFSLTDEYSNSIRNIEYKNPDDTLFFKLEIRITSENTPDSLSKGVISYFNKSAYYKQIYEAFIRHNRHMLEKADEEIQYLDSLQILYHKIIQESKNNQLFLLERSFMYEKILELQDIALDLKENISGEKIITVVHTIPLLNKTENQYLIYVPAFTLAALILAILFILTLSLIKRLEKEAKDHY